MGPPHAVRIVARAWLYAIWHCRQDVIPYDHALHKALQRILAGEKPAAAWHRATHAPALATAGPSAVGRAGTGSVPRMAAPPVPDRKLTANTLSIGYRQRTH